MVAEISPQPLVVGEIDLNIMSTDANAGLKPSFASVTLPKHIQSNIDLFKVNFDHDVPKIVFTMEDVNKFTREEGLHQEVVVKFSYGRPELSKVRRIFPSLFDVKGYCIIDQLEYRHLLVRFDQFNDYVQFISKSTGYLKSKGDDYFFRMFPRSFGFNPKEETSMTVVWISFPGLPPNLFAKRSILSIASAVGKPLAIDKATQDRSRPSAARVKVILNLLDKHPEKITLQFVDSASGKTFEFHQQIVYDNLPEYCVFCKHQGHDDKFCIVKIQKNQSLEEAVENQSRGKGNLVNTMRNNVGKLRGDARDFLNKKKAGHVDQIYVPVLKNAQQIDFSMVRPSEVIEKENNEGIKYAEGIIDENCAENVQRTGKDDGLVSNAGDQENPTVKEQAALVRSQCLSSLKSNDALNANSDIDKDSQINVKETEKSSNESILNSRDQSIVHNGQSDTTLNSTVALKISAENDQGNVKDIVLVSNAVDQEVSIVEEMIPTVRDQTALVGSQCLSFLKSNAALDTISESDKVSMIHFHESVHSSKVSLLDEPLTQEDCGLTIANLVKKSEGLGDREINRTDRQVEVVPLTEIDTVSNTAHTINPIEADSQLSHATKVDVQQTVDRKLNVTANTVNEAALLKQKEDEERYRLKGKAVAIYTPSEKGMKMRSYPPVYMARRAVLNTTHRASTDRNSQEVANLNGVQHIRNDNAALLHMSHSAGFDKTTDIALSQSEADQVVSKTGEDHAATVHIAEVITESNLQGNETGSPQLSQASQIIKHAGDLKCTDFPTSRNSFVALGYANGEIEN